MGMFNPFVWVASSWNHEITGSTSGACCEIVVDSKRSAMSGMKETSVKKSPVPFAPEILDLLQ